MPAGDVGARVATTFEPRQGSRIASAVPTGVLVMHATQSLESPRASERQCSTAHAASSSDESPGQYRLAQSATGRTSSVEHAAPRATPVGAPSSLAGESRTVWGSDDAASATRRLQ